MDDYRKIKSFEIRKSEYEKLNKMYPNKIPVIIDKSDLKLPNYKFLVNNDHSISHLLYIIRYKCKLNPDESIFLFVNGQLPPMNELMSNIYNKNKDADGFLYIQILKENTFG